MRPKVVLLSDLWGFRKSVDLNAYQAALPSNIDFKFYDSSRLAGVPENCLEQDKIHEHFINGGLQHAVEALIKQEKKIDMLIGLSIGGTVAWQYAILKKVSYLTCISATRLRYESVKPVTEIDLIYGDLDPHRPKSDWFSTIGLIPKLIPEEGHDVYRSMNIAQQVCQDLGKLIDKM